MPIFALRTKAALRAASCVLLLTVLEASEPKGFLPSPPATRRDGVVDIIHGVSIPDPYRWLEDQNSPETRAWIDAQMHYTESILKPLPGRDVLTQRLTELMKVETIGMPVERGGRYFFMKRAADQDLFVLHMREGLNGRDEVLVDPAPLSPDHTTSVTLEDVSRDGRLVAYGVREGGQDEVTVHFLDATTRQELNDRLPRGRYESVSLLPSGKGLFYSRQSDAGPRVCYHAFGSPPASDPEVFGKGYGLTDIISTDVSEDGRYLLITVSHGAAGDHTELWLSEVARPQAAQPLVKDVKARFEAQFGGDRLFVQTDWKAPNGRMMEAKLEHPDLARWREVIPQRQRAVIEGFSAAGGRLFVNYLQDVASRAEVFDADGRHVRDVAFPALGSVSRVSGRWSSNEAFFQYSSFAIPNTIYRYHMDDGRQEVWARLTVPVDSRQFEVRQVWYRSKDGTRVPMFLLARKGLKQNGNNPTLLTGYGGFDVSLTPAFSPLAVLWAEQGGVYAVPNLRGGGEFGEAWHRAGMFGNKQHVFDDFIAAAEWLIANRYTRPAKLAIRGGSNGGLLMGAMMTQRPDLFGAIVCLYPLLDMVRYHQFKVAQFWVSEYGSADDPQQFKYLYAYSPYHHVVKGKSYPAILFVSGDNDTRVDPLHARKMAALMQWANGSGKPILLRYDTKSGHSGGRPLGQQIEESVDELSFICWQLGVVPHHPS
jgi:prolyl oligopeptidase